MRSARRKSAIAAGATGDQGGDTHGSPLTPHDATELLQRIVRDGTVAWSLRALDLARAAGITAVECSNAMLTGVADPAALTDGRWQYRIHSPRIWIVMTFRCDTEAAVIDVGRRDR